ncbi:nucleotide sugar dehydrogenase [Fredinandcohnia sp. 179-A 10B2 NHS]|uniref:nucleotide sugar dehydrogenase n=1 Tax=Fredinandcohnia sp. 179-A 10B2 NHS TaxID=3235176 RepID=UPI0039A2D99C
MEKVTVVGLGKIGLPLATVFANSGNYYVIGADKNEIVVKQVNTGLSHIKNEPGVDELLNKAWKSGLIHATTNTIDAVSQSSIVVVIVPVLVNDQNKIDYQYIDSAVEDIGKSIKKDTLVIFETTIPTGDTRNRFGRKIEELSGLQMGEDFYLAYSPERVYSNRILKDLKTYPKVVSGINKKSLDIAAQFYRDTIGCDVLQVSSLETAEFTKVAEAVYRDVNIALVNELAIYGEKYGVDISEVIMAANSEPFSHLHMPGVGVGGHCIPVYPYFFINNGLDYGLVPLSRTVNDNMANYAVNLLEGSFYTLQSKNILILGLSFRENVKEATRSSTLLLVNALRQKGATIYIDDPLYTEDEIASFGVNAFKGDDKNDINGIILQAFHDEYKLFSFSEFQNCKVIVDGRNVLDKSEIQKLGITYYGIGIR